MKNADQPAHPIEADKISTNSKGLTKREYFAAMAMQGILSSGAEVGGKTDYHPDLIAHTAVRYADELLKQLES